MPAKYVDQKGMVVLSLDLLCVCNGGVVSGSDAEPREGPAGAVEVAR